MRINAIKNVSNNVRTLVKQAATPMLSEAKLLAKNSSGDKFVKSTKAKAGKKANKAGCGGGCSDCGCGGCGGGCYP